MTENIAGLVLGYLMGSVPFGLWFVRMFHGIDIRDYGSHNIGATNVYRTVGAKTALLVFICDMLKGFIPPLVMHLAGAGTIAMTLAALGASLGHEHSLFLGGKGGKGVSTGFGSYLYLTTKAGLIGGAVFLVVVLATRYVSLGSMLAALAIMIACWTMDYPVAYALFSTWITFFVILRHKDNIKRLLSGTESKIKLGREK